MTRVIQFFVSKHLITNFIFVLVIFGGIASWYDIRKEELPDYTFDRVSISTVFPGASPGEVEQAITLPLEHELASLEEIRRMTSTSRRGTSTIDLELRRDVENTELTVSEIQNRILAVKMPDEVEDPPVVRHRKTSQKAIIDIALHFKDVSLLTDSQRRELQHQTRLLENRLLRRGEISSLERSSYLAEEIHVMPRPGDLFRYHLGLNHLRASLRSSHTDLPLGIMETPYREQVRLDGRVERPSQFPDLPLRSSFSGNSISVGDVADIYYGFEDTDTLVRINGHEGTVLNVVKSSATGILDAIDVVHEELDAFMGSRDENSGLVAVLLDDESYDVRNRLSIISGNALIGFALILLVLSVFLNKKTAIWVSFGIPFSFLFTLIIANFLDFTVNNMTLAGVIIAMGMLVDDAIVVSENITRLREQGVGFFESAIEGTRQVLTPIIASILTTMAAFLPLMTFEGNLALFTTSIPPIVIMVLLGSFIESIIILPGHMTLKEEKPAETRKHWFNRVEGIYIRHLEFALGHRWLVFTGFSGFVLVAIILYMYAMNFSLFPREQMSNFFIVGEAPVHSDRYNTAKLSKPIEDLVFPYVGEELIGVRTTVGYRRYRPSNEENVVSVRAEFDERKIEPGEAVKMVDMVQEKLKSIKGFETLRVSGQRFGSDTGSALEILVQENNDDMRMAAAEDLADAMKEYPQIGYVEIDRPASEYEYLVHPKRKLISRLDIDPLEAESALRSALSGILLYSFYEDSEEKRVRLRFRTEARSDIHRLLKIPVSNREGYQVPLGLIMTPERKHSISEIERFNQRRVLRVLGDIKPDAGVTPLEMAEKLETTTFQDLVKKYPSITLFFDGEVRETRETSSFFQLAVIGVLLLVYFILTIQFNSILRPLMVMTSIIPAWSAVVYVFLVHGMSVYGFFTIVGGLGLSGIVVNSAILLLDKIDREGITSGNREEIRSGVARAASQRLRAVFLTTITTVAGLLPTAYGVAGYDSMLAEMMLTISWGLVFSMSVTLLLVPALASLELEWKNRAR